MQSKDNAIQKLPWQKNNFRQDSWHSMCSYLGAFPPDLVHHLINLFSKEGDLVFDPFSGRGTTLLESRILSRHAVVSDLNPIAIALSKAKNHDLDKKEVLKVVKELESHFDLALYLPEAKAESDDIKLIFNPRTLAQLCYLRRQITQSNDPIKEFLTGCVLGIMHGSERKDGTSGYASISMPNTFSMSPEYVRKFVQQRQLSRSFRDVFDILREKISRLYKNHSHLKGKGVVYQADIKQIESLSHFKKLCNKIDLVLTSPPYLGVVNYSKQNWIRNWFLDKNSDHVHEMLDDDLNLSEWLNFSSQYLEGIKKLLKDKGIGIFVIGDVAKSKNSVIPLAREFISIANHKNLFRHAYVISDRLYSDGKTTRIWGDTKGTATSVDRIVILSNYSLKDLQLPISNDEFMLKVIKNHTEKFLVID